jgi:hypothetical protein
VPTDQLPFFKSVIFRAAADWKKRGDPPKNFENGAKKTFFFSIFWAKICDRENAGKKAFFQKTATTFRCSVCRGQGDQIGRIFAFWANFRLLGDNCLSALFLITEVDKTLGLLFPTGKSFAPILSQKLVGLHFGQFFHQLIRSPWS